MRVDVSDIKETRGSQASYNVAGTVSVSLPGLESRLVGPVEVECTAANTGRSILIEGRARATASAACDRCLEPFRLTLHVPLCREYIRHGARVDAQSDALSYRGDEIEIDDAVREALLLEWPAKLVCSSACRGLCPRCGKNLNFGRCTCDGEGPGEGV